MKSAIALVRYLFLKVDYVKLCIYLSEYLCSSGQRGLDLLWPCSEWYLTHTMSLREAEGFAFDMQLRRYTYVLGTIFLLLSNSFFFLLATVQRRAFWKLKKKMREQKKSKPFTFPLSGGRIRRNWIQPWIKWSVFVI